MPSSAPICGAAADGDRDRRSEIEEEGERVYVARPLPSVAGRAQ